LLRGPAANSARRYRNEPRLVFSTARVWPVVFRPSASFPGSAQTAAHGQGRADAAGNAHCKRRINPHPAQRNGWKSTSLPQASWGTPVVVGEFGGNLDRARPARPASANRARLEPSSRRQPMHLAQNTPSWDLLVSKGIEGFASCWRSTLPESRRHRGAVTANAYDPGHQHGPAWRVRPVRTPGEPRSD